MSTLNAEVIEPAGSELTRPPAPLLLPLEHSPGRPPEPAAQTQDWISRHHGLLLLAICVLGIVLRFTFLDRPLLWGDDAYTIYRTHADYRSMLDILQNDGFTPLHYQLYWLIARTKTGTHPAFPGGPEVQLSEAMNPAMARILPAFWGALMPPAIYLLAVHLVRRRVALAIALVAACSAYLLGYSRDGKMYMMLWSLTALSTGCLLWWLKTGTRLAWLAWVASALGMCSAHMTGPAMLPFQAIFLFTRGARGWNWRQPILFVIGLAVAMSGPLAYMSHFNRWSQEQNKDYGFDVEGLGWVKPYNTGRNGTDLVNYAASAYLFSWEWPKPVSQPYIKPWLLNSLKVSAILLLVLAALGAMPWSRRLRGVQEIEASDRAPQPWWRLVLWLGLWMSIPTYFIYCRSNVDYVSPQAWHEWVGAHIAGDAWREKVPGPVPVAGVPEGIDLRATSLAEVLGYPAPEQPSSASPASTSRPSQPAEAGQKEYGLADMVAARGSWEPGYRTNHYFWGFLVAAVLVCGAFTYHFKGIRTSLMLAIPVLAVVSLLIFMIRVGPQSAPFKDPGDLIAHLWPALTRWGDFISSPLVLASIVIVMPGIVFYYCGSNLNQRLTRLTQFLLVAGVIYGACFAACAWTTTKFRKEFATALLAESQRLKSPREKPDEFVQRRQDLTLPVNAALKSLREGAQWHSIFMPRYFGFIWIGFCVALVTLYMRLPTRPLRVTAIVLLIGINLAQFGGRLFAETEPRLDLVARDVWRYDKHRPGYEQDGGDTGRVFVNDMHPSSYVARAGVTPDATLGGAGHPACGQLEGQQGRYYLGVERGYLIHPTEWKTSGSASRNFDFRAPYAGRSLDIDRILSELKNSPRVTKAIIWEKVAHGDPRLDPVTRAAIEPWQERAQTIVGQFEKAGWKSAGEARDYPIRFHWEWKELCVFVRMEFNR